MAGGIPGLGDISQYLNQAPAEDVPGGGLPLLEGQGAGLSGLSDIGGLLSLLGPSLDLSSGDLGGGLGGLGGAGLGFLFGGPLGAGLGSFLGSEVGDLLSSLIGGGLPANVKPQGAAQVLEQSGNPLQDILGQFIGNAQKQAGSGSGVLSQSGPGAFNEAEIGSILEALTGKDVFSGSGVEHLKVPGATKPVTLAVQPLKPGQSGKGFTPAELESPKAMKILENLTKGGFLGTGTGPGASTKLIPQITQALEKAGIKPQTLPIQPGQSGGGGGGNTLNTGGGSGGNTLNIPVQDLINTLILRSIIDPTNTPTTNIPTRTGQQTNQQQNNPLRNLANNPAALLGLLGGGGGGFAYGWS